MLCTADKTPHPSTEKQIIVIERATFGNVKHIFLDAVTSGVTASIQDYFSLGLKGNHWKCMVNPGLGDA